MTPEQRVSGRFDDYQRKLGTNAPHASFVDFNAGWRAAAREAVEALSVHLEDYVSSDEATRILTDHFGLASELKP